MRNLSDIEWSSGKNASFFATVLLYGISAAFETLAGGLIIFGCFCSFYRIINDFNYAYDVEYRLYEPMYCLRKIIYTLSHELMQLYLLSRESYDTKHH